MQGELRISTRGAGLTEITDPVADWLAGQGAENGLLTLLIRHTSASLLIQENADPDVQRDLFAWLSRLVPPATDPSLAYLRHTAEGPDDPAVDRFRAAVAGSGMDAGAANRQVGQALGRVLRAVLEQSLEQKRRIRAVVSGGDTSGHATQQLGIYALSALAPTIPGASIFRAHADGGMDGLELALKGGQMGSPDYFGWVRDGGGVR